MSGKPSRTLCAVLPVAIAAAVGALHGGLLGRAHAEGYHGVAPGSTVVPEGIAAEPGKAALVTWPGFQALPGGGSRVFVQTSVEVKPELKRAGKDYVLLLPQVALPPGNARLPLDTSFFNTPVKKVRAKPQKKGGGVLVELEMRASVAPTLRTEKAPTGYFFVYLDFPAGNFLPQ